MYGNSLDNNSQAFDKIYTIIDIIDINNTFITIADSTYQQCIGIPMGTNAGVNIAEYYLVKYEFNFLIQLRVCEDVQADFRV